MRKLTLILISSLIIICVFPFLTPVSAVKQKIVTKTQVVSSMSDYMTSFSEYGISDLSDHNLFYEVKAVFNETNVKINFMIISNALLIANMSNYKNRPESDYLIRMYNVSQFEGSVKIPESQVYWLIFENFNNFTISITFTLLKQEIGTTALIGGSIISGIGLLGFLVVIIIRKRNQSVEEPAEVNQ